MAPDIYERVRAKGLHIPNDISIVSRGDLIFANFLSPPLTTFRAPYFDIGYPSAEALIDVLKGKKSSPERILLPAPLIEREPVRRVSTNAQQTIAGAGEVTELVTQPRPQVRAVFVRLRKPACPSTRLE